MPEREFRASDLTRRSGEILHAASMAPITLTNHGKPRHVILSVEEFERLKKSGNTQMAFKMDEIGNKKKALEAYKYINKIRSLEIQSYRDLALSYAENGDVSNAFNIYQKLRIKILYRRKPNSL